MKKLWQALGEKGKIATIIGLLFALPINVKYVWDFYAGVPYTDFMLHAALVMNAIAMVWFILPSSIILKGGKFELEVKD